MKVAQRPGRRPSEDRPEQFAPDRQELHPRAGGRRRPSDRRRIPVERQLDLDQHRLDVVDRQGVGFVVDRQAFRQFAPVKINEKRNRLRVSRAVGNAALGDGG